MAKDWFRWDRTGKWVTTGPSKKSSRFTDAQRAAYWKKKYLDLIKEMRTW